ncbi:MAG TPA: hypothetical protein VJS64_16195 [Pyrinomonadaceae bacterium]|nr:hypothetical protein [Pyrinomonadaceae bacterium]
MRRTQLTAAVIAALLLVSIWIVGEKSVGQMQTTNPSPGLQQSLTQRRAVLTRHELQRNTILDQLEFLPRFPFPGPPFPFPELCLLPPATTGADIDPHRSLFVHDRPTLGARDFSLRRTLTQIANQVAPIVPGTNAVTIFRQFWDTQNTPPGVVPTSPHCTGTLNGFPINCPRNEGSEAVGTDAQILTRMTEYTPIALVNRLDLAHQGWRNCGEYRIVYGKDPAGIGKNFIIFEAVLPNPRPGCREGCVPVAEFWKALSTVNDPVERAKRLEEFYYVGLPGFRPVVHVNHYDASGVTSSYGSSGSGQIRTNQFLQTGGFQPWILKEFKTVIDCGVLPCKFDIVPTMVRVNPHGTLWNADNLAATAVDFRADTVLQTVQLGSGNLLGISYGVDLANDAGQSMSLAGPGFVDNYRTQMNAAADPSFRIAMIFGALTANQMANRALTQSCAGCHQPSTFGLQVPNSIGLVLAPIGSPVAAIDHWPGVVGAGFVHTDVPLTIRPELAANPAAFGAGQGHEISPALLDFFLPERENFLLSQLNAARCRCKRRFRFLDVTRRTLALEVEKRVRTEFEPRFNTLNQRILELQAANRPGEDFVKLAQEKTSLEAEQDKALAAALRQRNITLPDDEQLQLKPQTLKLKAGSAAGGSAARESELRISEVNQLLRQEPPRRTVSGSFRTH